MRLKWFGVLVLLLAMALTVLRSYVGTTVTGDTIVGLLMAFGVMMVIIDCKRVKKEAGKCLK